MSHLNPTHNASLAKLLATENLQVVHGTFSTASFDPVKRVLRLPIFKDMGKDAYDLMVGHEVGHALFTPAEGWKHGVDVEGLPAILINIVEDVRIERLIQNRYPGLIRSFKLGYQTLFDSNFFGTKDRPMESYGFLDRLNIKAKLRDLIDIEFSAEEQSFVDRSERTTTWEEVIDLCRDLKEFLDKQKEEAPETATEDFEIGQFDETDEEESTEQADNNSNQSSGQDSESTEDETGEESSEIETDESESEGEDSSKPAGSSDLSEEDEGEESASDGDDSKTTSNPGPQASLDPFESETDNTFRDREKELVDNVNSEFDKPILHLTNPGLKAWEEEAILGYKDILARIDEFDNRPEEERFASYDYIVNGENNYKNFLAGGARKAVNHMVKEFELRRSADRHARARTSTKGTLDTGKLHTYKYNDEVFRQVTTLADGKNHGLMVLVDFSGSMFDIFDGTIKNAIQLAMFCRQVNIPFQIYGFTSKGFNQRSEFTDPGYDVVDPRKLRLYDLFNHKQRKGEFERIANHLISLSQMSSYDDKMHMYGHNESQVINLGGTPLDTALLAMHDLIPDFQKKTGVQIMNLFVLTDGDSHSIDYIQTKIDDRSTYGHDFRVLTGKSVIDVPGHYSYVCPATAAFYASLKRATNSRVFGFHMTSKVNDAYAYYSKLIGSFNNYDVKDAIKFGFRKQGYAAIPVEGILDALYLMKPVSGEDDEFEVKDDISKQQLKKQFTNFMKSKKTNRLVFTEFGKMVA